MYCCIFGISIVKDGSWAPGRTQTTFGKGHSFLTITGPKNRVYWFLNRSIGKCHLPDLPRYTKADEEALYREFKDSMVDDTHSFGELYATKISSTLTALPEYAFKKWHFNRIMTIGDAAHKVSPPPKQQQQQHSSLS